MKSVKDRNMRAHRSSVARGDEHCIECGYEPKKEEPVFRSPFTNRIVGCSNCLKELKIK